MRKFLAGLTVALLMATPIINTIQAQTAAVISTGSVTTTDLTITVTTLATGQDSLYVINMPVGGADTVFVALLDTTATDTTLVGNDPGSIREWALLSRTDAGETAVSNKDTVRIEYPQVENRYAVNDAVWQRRLMTATSWRPTQALVDSFTISAAGDDSTGVWFPGKYTSIRTVTTQASDSLVATLLVYVGDRTNEADSRNDSFNFVLKDSINITTTGTNTTSLTSLPPSKHAYIFINGLAGTGKDASLRIEAITDNR